VAIQDNRILNWREMEAGKTVLESTPPNLGVDLHGVCNVKPPCVYCDWDAVKEEEGDLVDVPFTRETLEEWGPFFDNAESLINCGIGEPFMMKNLDELLDIFGDREKTLEMATNGQILTDRNIEKLVGRKVRLFVSLDAATPETYAKLRNDTLPKIIDNLRRLIAAKGGPGHYPLVWLNFMPMKVNVHELEAFVKLCAELNVDQMVLRPLNYSDDKGLDWERAGYHFVYEEELLPFAELVRISGRAAELCRRYGVTLGDFLDSGDASLEEYFPEDFADGRRQVETSSPIETTVEAPPPVSPAVSAAEPVAGEASDPAAELAIESVAAEGTDSLGDPRLPLCLEPWKHLYILRRGVLPCCYGQYPLEPMDRWKEVWNSPTLQAIRGDLAAGRLHSYCLESTSCPIVRKRLHGSRLPLRHLLLMRLRRAFHRVDRLAFGVPAKVYRGLRWLSTGRASKPLAGRD
jgi:MoaA/NifB/PqqE/SkfB family radical SAM enzyme